MENIQTQVAAMSDQPARTKQKRERKKAVPFRAIWWIAFVGVLAPLVWLIFNVFTANLGANPIEAINRYLGDWALRFLLITLAMTPLRIITNKPWPLRLRRMMGLAAFAYAIGHVSSYVVLDQFFAWGPIWEDILKRRFITVGMVVILMLLPLAITSSGKIAKRIGGKNWKRLHMAVYPAGALSILHFFWMVKADIREPIIYASIFAVLMAMRVISNIRKKSG